MTRRLTPRGSSSGHPWTSTLTIRSTNGCARASPSTGSWQNNLGPPFTCKRRSLAPRTDSMKNNVPPTPAMPLVGDVRDSFKAKGLEFVSLSDAGNNRSILTYKEGARVIKKEIAMQLSELEDTVEGFDVIDPSDIAEYLLKLK